MVLVYWRKRSNRGSIRSEIRSSVPMVLGYVLRKGLADIPDLSV